MTLQAPLPVLPARAVQVGDVAGLVTDETGGQVYVRGEVVFAWGPGDEACRRLAAVQLVELRDRRDPAGRGGVRSHRSNDLAVAHRVRGPGRGEPGRGEEGPQAGLEADRRRGRRHYCGQGRGRLESGRGGHGRGQRGQRAHGNGRAPGCPRQR